MADPYTVLGVSRDADEIEIKKAYRSLSKKYHPDNNPGNKAAEEVFKQVQAAYETIMKEKRNPGSAFNSYSSDNSYTSGSGFGGFYSDFGGFGGFSGQNTYGDDGQDDSYSRDLKSAAIYINNNLFDQALNVLNSMDERGHKWYYYSALANMGLGNNITALQHAKQALSLQPDNYDYQMLVDSIENGTQYYNNRSFDFSINPNSGGNLCFKVIICNLLLNLLCGGWGMCCGNGMGGSLPFYPGM